MCDSFRDRNFIWGRESISLERYALASHVSPSGGWSRGSIFSAAGCALDLLKSASISAEAIALRGAGWPVQMVHCAHP